MRKLLVMVVPIMVIPIMSAVLVAAAAQTSVPQGNAAPPRHTDEATSSAGPQTNQNPQAAEPENGAPKINPSDSSSKTTEVPLTPPPGEPGLDLNAGAPAADQAKYEWNPHRADHDVEVGDFYYKRQDYPAAVARYREALRWQDNHAIATFHLAEALEHLGQYGEARRNYQAYLRILPHGDYARKATKALQRLKDKPDQQKLATSSKPVAASQR